MPLEGEAHKAHVDVIDHTADIGLQIRASSAGQAFSAVALGMFDIMVDRQAIRATERRTLRVGAENWEDLLLQWLQELLCMYELDRLVPASCSIREIGSNALLADLDGEELDLSRHATGPQIKAVTYHQLRAEETADGFAIRVIFDI
ncbi:MAG: archease [Chloroflexi bacterium]|nr:MAG: archease [Chloroflexota bacterium]